MPTADVQLVDPYEVMAAMARKQAMPGRRRSEVVSYWKRPMRLQNGKPAAQAGWVITADTQTGKKDDFLVRGFRPLHEFGRVWDGDDEDGRMFKQYGRWGPILSKPGGPEQFPVEQLKIFRWYRPENVGSPAEGFPPMSWVRFPQLQQAVKDGLKIQEFTCPECESMVYLEALHLGRHLRITHDWDQQDLIAWGEAAGVDFRREFKAVRAIALVDFDELPASPVPVAPSLEPVVPIEAVVTPTREEVQVAAASGRPCIFCVRAKEPPCKKHRGKAA